MLSGLAACAVSPGPARAAADAIGAIERRFGGRLGVFARDTGDGRTLAFRADERFRLDSTFKGPLAAMVLWRVDAGIDSLGRPLRYGAADLVPGSPVTQANVGAGGMDIGALVKAILERSDNTAANLLLRHLGGPAALTAWLRAHGDAVTTVNRYEILPGQTAPENSTTPRAIADTAARISLGTLLSPRSRSLNNGWMAANALGMRRLRGGVPAGWTGIDRTGTTDSTRSDYAVVWPPKRAPLVIAAYYEKPELADGAGETVLRASGAAVAAWAAGGG